MIKCVECNKGPCVGDQVGILCNYNGARLYNKKIPFWQMRKMLRDKGLDCCPPRDETDRTAYYNAGVIRKEDLETGSYYWGTCRNADIAMWDKTNNCFWYIRTKFDTVFAEKINHLEDDDGYDLFLPLAKIELEE